MDDRLSFDVYAKITDPSCRVELDAFDSWVSVTIGSTPIGEPVNMLQLWFKEPETVTELGRALVSAGMRLADHRKGELSNLGGPIKHRELEESANNGL